MHGRHETGAGGERTHAGVRNHEEGALWHGNHHARGKPVIVQQNLHPVTTLSKAWLWRQKVSVLFLKGRVVTKY